MTHPQTEAKGADAKAAAMDAVGEAIGYTPKPCADADIGIPISQPDFVPCERTVRLLCDWFEGEYPHSIGPDNARKLFLPKDRAEELADKWLEDADWPDMGVRIAVIEYTRHLLTQGEIRG